MRSKVLRILALISLVLAGHAAPSLGAVYLLRPDGSGDFPTIQQALAAVDSADLILLANGTYTGAENRNIDFLGKAVTLRSQSGNPDSCILDCSMRDADPETLRRGFVFHNYEDSTSVVRDITIANGSAGGT